MILQCCVMEVFVLAVVLVVPLVLYFRVPQCNFVQCIWNGTCKSNTNITVNPGDNKKKQTRNSRKRKNSRNSGKFDHDEARKTEGHVSEPGFKKGHNWATAQEHTNGDNSSITKRASVKKKARKEENIEAFSSKGKLPAIEGPKPTLNVIDLVKNLPERDQYARNNQIFHSEEATEPCTFTVHPCGGYVETAFCMIVFLFGAVRKSLTITLTPEYYRKKTKEDLKKIFMTPELFFTSKDEMKFDRPVEVLMKTHYTATHRANPVSVQIERTEHCHPLKWMKIDEVNLTNGMIKFMCRQFCGIRAVCRSCERSIMSMRLNYSISVNDNQTPHHAERNFLLRVFTDSPHTCQQVRTEMQEDNHRRIHPTQMYTVRHGCNLMVHLNGALMDATPAFEVIVIDPLADIISEAFNFTVKYKDGKSITAEDKLSLEACIGEISSMKTNKITYDCATPTNTGGNVIVNVNGDGVGIQNNQYMAEQDQNGPDAHESGPTSHGTNNRAFQLDQEAETKPMVTGTLTHRQPLTTGTPTHGQHISTGTPTHGQNVATGTPTNGQHIATGTPTHVQHVATWTPTHGQNVATGTPTHGQHVATGTPTNGHHITTASSTHRQRMATGTHAQHVATGTYTLGQHLTTGTTTYGQPMITEVPTHGQPMNTEMPTYGRHIATGTSTYEQPMTTGGPTFGQPMDTGVPINGQPLSTVASPRGEHMNTGAPIHGQHMNTGVPINGQPLSTGAPPHGQLMNTGAPIHGQHMNTGVPINRQSLSTGVNPQGHLIDTVAPMHGKPITTGAPAHGQPMTTGPPTHGQLIATAQGQRFIPGANVRDWVKNLDSVELKEPESSDPTQEYQGSQGSSPMHPAKPDGISAFTSLHPFNTEPNSSHSSYNRSLPRSIPVFSPIKEGLTPLRRINSTPSLISLVQPQFVPSNEFNFAPQENSDDSQAQESPNLSPAIDEDVPNMEDKIQDLLPCSSACNGDVESGGNPKMSSMFMDSLEASSNGAQQDRSFCSTGAILENNSSSLIKDEDSGLPGKYSSAKPSIFNEDITDPAEWRNAWPENDNSDEEVASAMKNLTSSPIYSPKKRHASSLPLGRVDLLDMSTLGLSSPRDLAEKHVFSGSSSLIYDVRRQRREAVSIESFQFLDSGFNTRGASADTNGTGGTGGLYIRKLDESFQWNMFPLKMRGIEKWADQVKKDQETQTIDPPEVKSYSDAVKTQPSGQGKTGGFKPAPRSKLTLKTHPKKREKKSPRWRY